jgi:hypothetical protein
MVVVIAIARYRHDTKSMVVLSRGHASTILWSLGTIHVETRCLLEAPCMEKLVISAVFSFHSLMSPLMSIPKIGAFAVLQLAHHGRHRSIVILSHANYTHPVISCITSDSGIHNQVADLVNLDPSQSISSNRKRGVGLGGFVVL